MIIYLDLCIDCAIITIGAESTELASAFDGLSCYSHFSGMGLKKNKNSGASRLSPDETARELRLSGQTLRLSATSLLQADGGCRPTGDEGRGRENERDSARVGLRSADLRLPPGIYLVFHTRGHLAWGS